MSPPASPAAAKSRTADQVLQTALARLAAEPGLPRFFETVLLVCAEQIGAACGALFTLEETRRGYCLRSFIRQGQVLVVESDPLLAVWKEPVPPEESILADERFRRGETLLHDIPTIEGVPDIWPRSIAFHRRLGHRTVLSVPLLLHGRLLGFLGMGFTERADPAADQIEFVRVLAGQASLAFELTRLAQQAQEAALARERAHAAEQRAAELVHANQALQQSIQGLASIADLDEFLAGILRAALEVAGAHTGAVVLARGDAAEHVVLMEHGRRVPRAQQEAEGTFRIPINAALRAYMERSHGGGDIWVVPPDDAAMTPAFVAYHRSRGNLAVRLVPMVVGARLIGWLGLGFASVDPPAATQPQLLRVLAEQMTVAIEMSRLAIESQESALARERVQFSQARAAELEETNALLSRSLQPLSGTASPDTLVTRLQLDLCALLGGERMSQFRLDWGTRRISGYTVVEEGRSIAEDDPAFLRLELGFDDVPAWKDSLQEDRVLRMDPQCDAALMARWTVEFMRTRGYRWLVNLPLFVHGRPAWVIAVMGRDEGGLTGRRLELFRLLARQLTLALELRGLSEEARQSAAAREREQAAQAHADELARTNEAMRRGSEAIAAAGTDTAVMGALLTQATAATGAVGAAVKRRTTPGASQVTLVAISQQGRVLETTDLKGLPCVAELERVSRADPTGYYAGLFAGTLQSRPCDAILALHEPHAAAYHAAHGHRLIWDYPFREEGEVAGWISLAFAEERPVDATALQILSVLSSHVALALKMIRLSALAREAAVNEERNRLAGEIHDSLAQSFAGIAMQLESAEDAALHDEHPSVLNGLRRAREVARFGLAEARRSVLALRPSDALAGGLAGALQSLVERSRVDKLLECRFEAVGAPAALGGETEMQLFRVAQEAVGNAVRHGRPTRIDVTLTFAANHVRLRVQDNGCGFVDPVATQRSAIGGLLSIQRRVESLGGNCEIESVPAKATTVNVRIPRAAASTT